MGYVTITNFDGSVNNIPDLPTYLNWAVTKPGIMSSDPPTEVTQGLVDFVDQWCSLNGGLACAGFNQGRELQTAIDNIWIARNAGVPLVNGGGTYYPNAQQACSSGYVLADNGNCVEKPTSYIPPPPSTNPLVTGVPTYSPLPPTIQPTNALNPPTGYPPVTQQQISNTSNQGITQNTYAGPNMLPPLEVTNWLQQNWMLLAAGAAGLFLLSSMRK